MSVTCCTPHLYSPPLKSVTPCRTSAIRGGDKNVVHILAFKINEPITTDIYVTKAWIVLSLDESNSPLVTRFCCWAGYFSHLNSWIGKWQHCYPWCLLCSCSCIQSSRQGSQMIRRHYYDLIHVYGHSVLMYNSFTASTSIMSKGRQLREEVASLLLIYLDSRVIHLSRVRTKRTNWQFSPFCVYLVCLWLWVSKFDDWCWANQQTVNIIRLFVGTLVDKYTISLFFSLQYSYTTAVHD